MLKSNRIRNKVRDAVYDSDNLTRQLSGTYITFNLVQRGQQGETMMRDIGTFFYYEKNQMIEPKINLKQVDLMISFIALTNEQQLNDYKFIATI